MYTNIKVCIGNSNRYNAQCIRNIRGRNKAYNVTTLLINTDTTFWSLHSKPKLQSTSDFVYCTKKCKGDRTGTMGKSPSVEKF